MKFFLERIVLPAIASAVIPAAIVVIAFVLTGRWPPREILFGASLGGVISPFAWRAYRAMSNRWNASQVALVDADPGAPD